MGNPINVAVIGVGYLGKIHAKIYSNLEGVRLVAVVDTDQAVATAVAEQYQCLGFTNIDEVLNLAGEQKVEAVSVVVPTSYHLQVAEPFIKNGVHMLLEKPVAPTVTESQAIVNLAKEQGTILQIGHLERFNAGVMKLAELAKEPRFIEVHRLGPFVGRATDVDVVTDLMIHDIDIVLSLVPSNLQSISATGAKVLTNHVDIANARLEFENGTVANVTASRVSRNQFRRIRVFSENHYLGLNFADQQLEEVKTIPGDDGDQFGTLQENQIEVKAQLPLNAEIADFIACVRHNKEPLVSGDAGLTAVIVADKVKQKIAESVEKIK